MIQPPANQLQSSLLGFPPMVCSIEQAARMLGISRSSLFQLIKKGGLHPVKIGRRTLVPIKDLEAYLGQLGGGQ